MARQPRHPRPDLVEIRRRKLGMNRETFAPKARVSRNTIYRLEVGIGEPQIEERPAIASAYGLTLPEFDAILNKSRSAAARESNSTSIWSPKRSPQFNIRFLLRTVELDFVTESAEMVHQTRSARIRATAPNVLSYVDHMSTDGQIDAIEVHPGTFEPMRTEGGDVFLRMMLVRPLNEGEETDVSMRFKLLNSFSDPHDEYWSIRVNHPTDLVRLVIRFHPERPYRTYRGLERFTTHESLHEVQPTGVTMDGKPSLAWEIPEPGVGCVYKLCWSW